MRIRIHPHARQRMVERGASEAEVLATVEQGEQFPAKLARQGFRRNFPFGREWRGSHYRSKQVEAIAVAEDGWFVITITVKYF
jgi:hypothetical protein